MVTFSVLFFHQSIILSTGGPTVKGVSLVSVQGPNLPHPDIFKLVHYRPQQYVWKGNVFTGVCLSTGGEVYTPPRQTPPWADVPLGRHHQVDTPRRDGHCSRRYASYWNAFLLGSMYGRQAGSWHLTEKIS